MSQNTDIAVAIIGAISDTISSFAWPLTLLVFSLIFRKEVGKLISRVKNIKYPGGELNTHQEEDPDAPEPTKEAERQIELFDPTGFRTKNGVKQLVSESGLFDESEKLIDSLLIFRTRRQRTWLSVTNRQVFCILDDENTRARGRLIQWRLPLSSATPVKAHISRKGNNVLDVGVKKNWLYSSSLHEVDTELEEKVNLLISMAKQSA
jgi:hypothetical protein